MWKLKYQLALHLRGQYHYPITTKAAKTHSSSGIIKLSQWEYKASSSLSWWHSSAIWEAIPVCTMSAITSLTSVHLNSCHELKWLKALVAPSCLASSATGGWSPGQNGKRASVLARISRYCNSLASLGQGSDPVHVWNTAPDVLAEIWSRDL